MIPHLLTGALAASVATLVGLPYWLEFRHDDGWGLVVWLFVVGLCGWLAWLQGERMAEERKQDEGRAA